MCVSVLYEYVWGCIYPYMTVGDKSDIFLNNSSPWLFKLRDHWFSRTDRIIHSKHHPSSWIVRMYWPKWYFLWVLRIRVHGVMIVQRVCYRPRLLSSFLPLWLLNSQSKFPFFIVNVLLRRIQRTWGKNSDLL